MLTVVSTDRSGGRMLGSTSLHTLLPQRDAQRLMPSMSRASRYTLSSLPVETLTRNSLKDRELVPVYVLWSRVDGP